MLADNILLSSWVSRKTLVACTCWWEFKAQSRAIYTKVASLLEKSITVKKN